LTRGFADLLHEYAVGNAGHGALIGRIGSADYAQAFAVGASKEFDFPVTGRLFLGLTKVKKTQRLPREASTLPWTCSKKEPEIPERPEGRPRLGLQGSRRTY